MVVTSCHNCVDGLTDLIRHYKLDMEVTQLVNLVANALVIEEKVGVPVETPVVPEKIEEVPVPVGVVPEPVAVEEAEELVPVGMGAEGEELPLAGRRILVADDELDQLDFISMVLEDNGAEIFKATTGDEVLAMARSIKPDILTLDLHMPGTGRR